MHLLIIQHMSVNPFGADLGGLQQPEFLARPVSLERLLPNRFAPSCSQHLGFSWRVIFGGRSLKRQVPFAVSSSGWRKGAALDSWLKAPLLGLLQ